MTDSTVKQSATDDTEPKKFYITMYILMGVLFTIMFIAVAHTVFSPATAANTPYSVVETEPLTNERNQTFRVFFYYDEQKQKQSFAECGKTPKGFLSATYYCTTEDKTVTFTYTLGRYRTINTASITIHEETYQMNCAPNSEKGNGLTGDEEICIPVKLPTPTPTRETHTEQQTLPPYTPEKG